jgi:deazaflavin-dependent oxidoreductase (nitroreductase family)
MVRGMATEGRFPLRIRVLRRFNALFIWILRSALHSPMSKDLLVLEYRGRKSGKPYAIPLAYVEHDGAPYCVTREYSSWWKNVAAETPVTIWLRGVRTDVIAQRVAGTSAEAHAAFTRFLIANPGTASLVYQVRIDSQRQPDASDVDREIHHSVVVRLRSAPAVLSAETRGDEHRAG